MTTAAQNLNPGVYVTSDVGLEVTDGTRSRVQIGHLVATGDYGIRVVSSDGTTVIIDGTSDMFKIAATGTQSLNVGASSGETAVSVTLTGLGTYTTCPAYLAVETADTTSQTSNRHSGQFRFNNGGFIASVSGGATTFQVVASSTVFNTGITLTGASSGNAVVTLWANNQSANAYANSGNRYWVLQEVAL